LHTGKDKEPQPRKKLRRQEDAIVAEVERQGYDPMSLPMNLPGKAGIKAAVREALQDSTLFKAITAFDKTWERLRTEKRIQDVPPHK
jgi:hypothetical protein